MQPDKQKPAPQPTKGYGKRPLWQWLLLYVVIGGIIYFVVYLLAFHHSSGSGSGFSY